MSRRGLGGDDGVGLAVVGAPFRMADDHGLGAGIGQHLGGDIAGMGAVMVRVAILGAEQDGASRSSITRLEHSSVAGGQIMISASGRGPFAKTIEQRPELGQVRAQGHASSNCRRRAA